MFQPTLQRRRILQMPPSHCSAWQVEFITSGIFEMGCGMVIIISRMMSKIDQNSRDGWKEVEICKPFQQVSIFFWSLFLFHSNVDTIINYPPPPPRSNKVTRSSGPSKILQFWSPPLLIWKSYGHRSNLKKLL